MFTDKIRNILMSVGLLTIVCSVAVTPTRAQSSAPSTPATSTSTTGNYNISSSIEFGYRFSTVNGDREKYNSDLNYRAGFRILDSSFLIEDIGNTHKFIDSALITVSGWGSDPSGSAMVKMNKAGVFKFDSNVRRVVYSNNLKNFATNWSQPYTTGSEHQFNTKHYFGDFDLTLLPDNEKFRFHLGYGFNNTSGPGAYTMRWPSFTGSTTTTRGDEFQVNSRIKNTSDDFRAGAEGNLLGFNWGLNYGHRLFRDNQRFTIDTFNPGNSPVSNTASINSFFRDFPTRGTTDFVNASFQRTFAKKLDVTGRVVYSLSRTNFLQTESGSGLSSASGTSTPQLIIDLDQANVTGTAKRHQTRADVGMTYRATDAVRISDTFDFDQFNISGQNQFLEYLTSRTTGGVARPNDLSNNTSWRATNYRRFTNLVEADFQINNMFAFNVGYRYTRRTVALGAFDFNVVNSNIALNEAESFKNTTNSVIAGTKIRPTKNWSIFADFEKGTSDTPFTRLANGKFTNFRVRTRASMKKFGMSASFISKDNDIPGEADCGGLCTLPITPTIANTKSRVFSAAVDWTPRPEVTFSSGYTYNWMDTNTDIVVPVGSPIVSTTTWFFGTSKFFMRDSYFYADVTARPTKRVSFYASYRINDDPGQGSQAVTRPQDIYSSYPMRFQTPEARVTIRLTKNIDWNLGYQYYSYRETPIQNPLVFIVITGQPNRNQIYPAQNYTAHLPYTSIRIYFGNGAADR